MKNNQVLTFIIIIVLTVLISLYILGIITIHNPIAVLVVLGIIIGVLWILRFFKLI